LSLKKVLKTFVFLISIFLYLGIIHLSFFDKAKNQIKESVEDFPLTRILTGEINRNESLYLSLLKYGVPLDLVYQLTQTLSQVFDLKKSLPGDKFTLITTTEDSLLTFEYHRGVMEKYKIENRSGELEAKKEPIQLTLMVRGIKGRVENNLWDSMIGNCDDPELILKFADVFTYEIDFLTEVKNGDEYRLVFEEYEKDGEFVKYGEILACEYVSEGVPHTAIFYEDPKGEKEYYNLEGKSLKKSFLRSPLNYRRISSRFSYSRFHPVLKVYRPHLGVDYAAAIGTPVVASGDGTVIFAGRKGGLGKTVEIRHSKGMITSYGHLSGFANGIRSGVRVSQKDVIGYVGRTGIATGPHLDYRVKVNGKYVNPLKMVVNPGDPVKKEYIEDFKNYSLSLSSALNLLCPDQPPDTSAQLASAQQK
jgi:murein DD-endopeptidase MepM/ murein hydrolase activator NlpD